MNHSGSLSQGHGRAVPRLCVSHFLLKLLEICNEFMVQSMMKQGSQRISLGKRATKVGLSLLSVSSCLCLPMMQSIAELF